MREDKTLELLAKCLELIESDMDGEALAAAKRANALRLRMGKSWRDLLQGDPRPSQQALEAEKRAGELAREVQELRGHVAVLEGELAATRKKLLEAPQPTSTLEPNHSLSDQIFNEDRLAMHRREHELRRKLEALEMQLESERMVSREATEYVASVEDQLIAAQRNTEEKTKELSWLNERFRKLEECLAEMQGQEKSSDRKGFITSNGQRG